MSKKKSDILNNKKHADFTFSRDQSLTAIGDVHTLGGHGTGPSSGAATAKLFGASLQLGLRSSAETVSTPNMFGIGHVQFFSECQWRSTRILPTGTRK